MATKFLNQRVRVKMGRAQDQAGATPHRPEIMEGPKSSFHIQFNIRPNIQINIHTKTMTWQQALQWSDSLGDGWRLPTVHDLRLICASRKQLTVLSDCVFRAISGLRPDEHTDMAHAFFWSGSDLPPAGDYAAMLCLSHGSIGQAHILNHLNVFCVKTL